MGQSSTAWKFLVMAFTAVALAVAVLPGCGDDTTHEESDSEFSPPTHPLEP